MASNIPRAFRGTSQGCWEGCWLADCFLLVETLVAVHSLSHARLFVTPWTAAYQASPSPEFAETHVH